MNLKQQRLLNIRDQKKKALDNEVTESLTAQVSTNPPNITYFNLPEELLLLCRLQVFHHQPKSILTNIFVPPMFWHVSNIFPYSTIFEGEIMDSTLY